MNRKKRIDFFLKLNRVLKKEDGSALFFVMISVLVLAVLSAILISMSVVNTRMKYGNIVVKKNRYYTESGIDQVYSKIGGRVANSLLKADDESDDFVNDMMKKIEAVMNYEDHWDIVDDKGHIVGRGHRWPDMHQDFDACKNYLVNTSHVTEYAIAIDDSVDADGFTKLEKDAQNKFTNEYKKALKDGIDVFVADLNNDANYKKEAGVKSLNISVTRYDDASLATLDDTSSETVMGFAVTSIVEYKDDTNKTINTDVLVNSVNKEYEFIKGEKKVSLKDNPAWQHALVVSDDVVVNTKVNIKGDVYDFAQIKEGAAIPDPDDPTTFKGVMLKGGSYLGVDGDVIGGGYVQLAEGSSGTINIKGLVHANTVITQRGSTGSLKIGGNAYTKDDLELNGDGSKIVIDGNYYGYYDNPAARSHDTSSAIVINTDDKDSKIEIKGTSDTYKKGEYEGGTFISGYAYINDEEDKYLTAESVSFKKNSPLYTIDFAVPIINDEGEEASALDVNNMEFLKKASDGTTKDEYDTLTEDEFNNRATVDTPNSTGYLVSNTSAVDLQGHKFNKTYKDKGADEPLNQRDKKALFLGFQETYDEVGDFLFKGEGEDKKGPKVDIASYLYTEGLRLSEDSAGEKRFNNGFGEEKNNATNNNRQVKTVSTAIKSELYDDYKYYLNAMRKRDGETVPSSMQDDVDGIVRMTKLKSSSYNVEQKDEWVKIVDTSSSSVDITGVDGKNGIIAVKGDIHFIENTAFKGPIICGGSVYFDGGSIYLENNIAGEKDELSHEEYEFKKEIATMIMEDENLKNLFDVSVPTGDPFKFKIYKTSTQESSDRNPVQNYDNYMEITHWTVKDE